MPVDRRSLFAVAAGGAAGAGVRWAVVSAVGGSGSFPWWTLAVNLAGCLVLGSLWRAPRQLALLAGTGFCGGLTTFSTFSVELAAMLDRGDGALAAAYLAASMIGGIAAVAAGRTVSIREPAAPGRGR